MQSNPWLGMGCFALQKKFKTKAHNLVNIALALHRNQKVQFLYRWDLLSDILTLHTVSPCYISISQIPRFMGQTWGPPGSCRPQMGPMMAPWILLSGMVHIPGHPQPGVRREKVRRCHSTLQNRCQINVFSNTLWTTLHWNLFTLFINTYCVKNIDVNKAIVAHALKRYVICYCALKYVPHAISYGINQNKQNENKVTQRYVIMEDFFFL